MVPNNVEAVTSTQVSRVCIQAHIVQLGKITGQSSIGIRARCSFVSRSWENWAFNTPTVNPTTYLYASRVLRKASRYLPRTDRLLLQVSQVFQSCNPGYGSFSIGRYPSISDAAVQAGSQVIRPWPKRPLGPDMAPWIISDRLERICLCCSRCTRSDRDDSLFTFTRGCPLST